MKAKHVTVSYLVNLRKPTMNCDIVEDTFKNVDFVMDDDSIVLKKGGEIVATWYLDHVLSINIVPANKVF